VGTIEYYSARNCKLSTTITTILHALKHMTPDCGMQYIQASILC